MFCFWQSKRTAPVQPVRHTKITTLTYFLLKICVSLAASPSNAPAFTPQPASEAEPFVDSFYYNGESPSDQDRFDQALASSDVARAVAIATDNIAPAVAMSAYAGLPCLPSISGKSL